MARKLWIAVSTGRQSATIKHHEASWSALRKRLLDVKRTAETYEQYLAMPRDNQLDIKDVGSFVGGKFSGDSRRKDELEFRSVLCLDLDHLAADNLPAIGMTYGGKSYVLHSTHKHSAAHPRLRLVFPLSRNVTIHEYEPLAREVASWLGMEAFDSTGFQPARVMFWPSASADADVVAEGNEGTWLSPDDILNAMDDWSDPFTWPLCPTEKQAPRAANARVEYAPDKKGVIGAFCREFDIHSAIAEFELPYELTSSDNRYSFAGGSSAQGAVVYDFDTQLFSHHESDPAHGLHNAWDLVRIHRFGELDKDIDTESVGPTHWPSYRALQELVAAKHPQVLRGLGGAEDIQFTDISGESVQDPVASTNNEHVGAVDTQTFLVRARDAIDNCQTREDFERFNNTVAAKLDALTANQQSEIAGWVKDQYNIQFGKNSWSKGSVLDTFKDLRKQLAGAVQADAVDVLEELANYVYRERFDNGRFIRRIAKQFWRYQRGLWSPMGDEPVKGYIQDTIVQLRKSPATNHPALQAAIGDKQSNTVAGEVLDFFKSQQAFITAERGTDPLGLLRKYELPVINCLNCTLWFDEEGKMTAKAHEPDDFFTSQLNVEYDPHAKCPEWDSFMDLVFHNEPFHSDEMVRHLEEYAGYAVQMSRWIKMWSLFIGPTNTGKSTFQELLIRMMGPNSVLTRTLSSAAWESEFGESALLGKLLVADDDMQRSLVLDDSMLKRFSEDKTVTASVKFAEPVTFISRVFFMINSNHSPRVKDITDAMKDRAFVMPFEFNFRDAGVADDRKRDRMYQELPGILNRFIAGLQRLRARGNFQYPAPCTVARDGWLSQANPVAHFIAERMVRVDKGGVTRGSVYEAYQLWYLEEYGGRASGSSKSDVFERLYAVLGQPSRYNGQLSFLHWDLATKEIDIF